MLEENNRENQIIEILTFVCGALAGFILLYIAYQFWFQHPWEATVWVGTIALASLFFAAEEISWGQKFFAWVSSAAKKRLANAIVPTQTVASQGC